MKGTYYIGANPRTAIPVVVAGRQLIATGFAQVTDPAVYWLRDTVQPGDVVDQIGSCSFYSNGIDPRAADGGATFKVETEAK